MLDELDEGSRAIGAINGHRNAVRMRFINDDIRGGYAELLRDSRSGTLDVEKGQEKAAFV